MAKWKERERKLSKKKMALLLDNHHCRGCGAIRGLTLSHLIKRSRRPDLILDDRNLTIHCIHCHDAWEYQKPFSLMMLDYKRNLHIVKELDLKEYDRWLYVMRKN